MNRGSKNWNQQVETNFCLKLTIKTFEMIVGNFGYQKREWNHKLYEKN